MPGKTRIVTTPTDATYDTLDGDLRTFLRKNLEGVQSLVVERRNRGPSSGPLPQVVDVDRDAGESDEDLVSSLVDELLPVIRRDAVKPRGRGPHPNAGVVAQWEGAVLAYGNAAKKGKPKLLDTLLVEIENPEHLATVESEGIAIMKEARGFFSDATKGLVAVYGALGKREKYQAKMFKAMATGQTALSKSSAKWKFRERREQEETERADIGARERTAKRNFFWSAIESIGVEWKDVGEIWSRYYTAGRKPGDPAPPPPTKPTEDECRKIFGGRHSEVFERQYDTGEGRQSLRTVVATMVAEPDFERRRVLSRIFLAVALQIADAKNLLRQALLEHVNEQRAQAIVAWLALPVTF